eukprot:jgi/Picsp_1/4344/NSC_01850-R1_dna mismatch repair protein
MNESRKSIKAILPASVHKLCSGQVIFDLATAVKELVENSIDAGASSIDIRLKEYGSELIEVSDNGSGVTPDDRKSMMLQYHTSKLSKFDDLEGIATFGFRGEALSSLCSISHVSVVTRVEGEECGSKLEYGSNGSLVSEVAAARSVGTTVAVRDLFHSLPVRYREFKKNLKRDYSRLVSMLHAYALIYTNIRFVCTNQAGGSSNARTVVVATGQPQTRSKDDGYKDQRGNRMLSGGAFRENLVLENVRALFGKRVADSLIPLSVDMDHSVKERCSDHNAAVEERELNESGIIIEGFVSSARAGVGKSTGDKRFFFINGRPIDFPKAGNCLNETFKMFSSPAITNNTKPMAIVNFIVPSNEFDVNVTPDKRKVFLHREIMLLQRFKNVLTDTWEPSRSTFRVQKVVVQETLRVENFQMAEDVATDERKSMSVSENNTCNYKETGVRDTDILHEDNKNTTEVSNVVCEQHGDEPRVEESLDTAVIDLASNQIKPMHRLSEVEFPEIVTSTKEIKKKSQNKMQLLSSFALKTPSIHVSPNVISAAQVDEEGAHKRKRKSKASTEIEKNDEKLENDIGTHEYIARNGSTSELGEEEEELPSDSKSCENETSKEPQSEIQHISLTNTSKEDKMDVGDVIQISEQCATCPNDVNNKEKLRREVSLDNEDDEENAQGLSLEIDLEKICLMNLENAREIKKRKSASRPLNNAFTAASMTTVDPDAFANDRSETSEKAAEEELERTFERKLFKEMKVIGQFNLGFIIGKLGKDLFIVDQHASDEKFNFENLQRSCSFKKQRLIRNQTLSLSPREEQVVKENVEVFQNNGFDLQENEDGVLELTAVPHCKGMTFGLSDMLEMVEMIERGERSLWHMEKNSVGHKEGNFTLHPSRFRALLASKACRTSIMIGKALTKAKMREILDNLSTLVSPWNCPHGRPTMRHLAYIK